jgi:hypothetical protein
MQAEQKQAGAASGEDVEATQPQSCASTREHQNLDATSAAGRAHAAQSNADVVMEEYKKALPKLGFNNALMFELD